MGNDAGVVLVTHTPLHQVPFPSMVEPLVDLETGIANPVWLQLLNTLRKRSMASPQIAPGALTLTVADIAGAYPSANPASYVNAAGAATAAPVQTVAGRTGAVVLAVGDVSGAYPSANPASYVNAAGAATAAPVQSVAGRAGAVVLAVGDVSGAYPSANPTGYQTAAQVSTSVGTETTRATNAEALLAPKASPAFTGAITVANGAGFFGHAAPMAQPATPVTLADVVALLRGCGLAA